MIEQNICLEKCDRPGVLAIPGLAWQKDGRRMNGWSIRRSIFLIHWIQNQPGRLARHTSESHHEPACTISKPGTVTGMQAGYGPPFPLLPSRGRWAAPFCRTASPLSRTEISKTVNQSNFFFFPYQAELTNAASERLLGRWEHEGTVHRWRMGGWVDGQRGRKLDGCMDRCMDE